MESPPALGTSDLHLWRIRTDGAGWSLEACLAALGERQRERALAMSHAAYRERWIRAQAGLRAVLGTYLGIEPKAIGFRRGPAGKPYLNGRTQDGHGDLHFNLTTTGDLALVGIARGAELGVDCELIRPRREIEGIARRMLDPAQVDAILSAPEEGRLERFYRAWTALEADAKSDGRGLFRPRAPDAPVPPVAHCIPEHGYVAAVARAALPPVRHWHTLELKRPEGYL